MKKILTLVLGLFCMTAVAQNRPTFIIQGGYQGANISGDSDSKLKSGFRAGVMMDYAFMTSDLTEFSIQSGLNYSEKGFRKEASVGGAKGAYDQTLRYIDLPILLNGRFKMSESINAFVNAGPYLAYGISTNQKISGKIEGFIEIDRKPKGNLFKEGGKDNKAVYNPFDMGVQIGAGIEISRFMVGVGTQYGLLNIEKEGKGSSKNISFFGSVGYRF
ncbi:porin family protein [Porphyromonas sp.]|uniref:porin family protein n=1 Tax=Porphyromonas sp. TaxID=1924944 RepID=UPI0026DBE813|nr:porin family protein [Porphyromonas sp.]MDO4695536.1 porin family protein [Porphyromonas sp.]MDO4771862.1 porin family protein [Porphyromonas sp.]